MEIKIVIQRQENPDTKPYLQTFLYKGDGALTVADLLAEMNAREPLMDADGKPAPRISFASSCHEKKCGACAMLINGTPKLACSVFLSTAVQKDNTVHLAPLSKFPVIRDLVADRSATFAMLEKMQVWLTRKRDEGEEQARQLQYAAGQCLACGCCLEVCPNYLAGNAFGGAAAMIQAYKAIEQNEDDAHRAELKKQYEEHFFNGCSQSLACAKVCPARLPLETIQARANAHLLKKHSILQKR
ncbi:MAG: succinate dehydrogenase/fumarate reductase iron-sulfur subunit [Acidaminococcaceae bacterium]|nr:succinate dehydrogenase/fumarate reductase iron-sulfur subunit [Acidaminococcaceae bacterium]